MHNFDFHNALPQLYQKPHFSCSFEKLLKAQILMKFFPNTELFSMHGISKVPIRLTFKINPILLGQKLLENARAEKKKNVIWSDRIS